MPETETLPLFPLGLVMFPGMILPLHIFEERYKLMISECLDQDGVPTGKKFGIVFYTGEKFHNTGCSAEVIKVIKKYDDGRMDIITEGRERFHIDKTFDDKPYMEAAIRYFDDIYETDFKGLEQVTGQAVELLNRIMKMTVEEKELPAVHELEPKALSFLIASVSGFTFDEKQSFLEIINTRERLEKCLKSLQKIMDRLIMTKDIEKIIQGNGYLPHKK
jgi:Lon protease-like protein